MPSHRRFGSNSSMIFWYSRSDLRWSSGELLAGDALGSAAGDLVRFRLAAGVLCKACLSLAVNCLS